MWTVCAFKAQLANWCFEIVDGLVMRQSDEGELTRNLKSSNFQKCVLEAMKRLLHDEV